MTTVVKFLIAAALALFLSSCQIDRIMGVTGNGNVQTENRHSVKNFTAIKASSGLNVYITQDANYTVKVEADENLINLIRTEVSGGELRIYPEKNIGRAKSKKVYVSLPEVTAITSSSGSDVYVENILKADNLELKSTSGSALRLETEADNMTCRASSGANIRIKGTANTLKARASSGSVIKAEDLQTARCDAEASSGGNISVFVTEDLTASASSGGDIRYSGNPESVSTGKSVSGSVRKD
ncbi:head GIN domain-containing protein [Sinomicrobium weinanense]|uniref:DUF2807 domain-containing protein n=1 Tax=Sinomicrobium weinanense TaxID=2842200 RepID=A0A926JRZ1_9FLAO|nr:head GIN domain-containing protein [Sinomicrobium weinanense]MBC9796291.1 DUF2807 domain-containing protein [Sinomicrobium weinanense]MBU3123228.1 DUF2807 domain-containing protein [Sinomicrobium weinanense]